MTDKKEIEELARIISENDKWCEEIGNYHDLAEFIVQAGYSKSKLVELDKLQVKELLDKFISCATNREEIAQVLCSRFGTKKVDVERIRNALVTNGAEHEHPDGKYYRAYSGVDWLAQAIVKELEG